MNGERPYYLTLEPRDPVIARDGRPFAAGLRMRSLDWIYPSVIAGAVRTMVGQEGGGFPAADTDAYRDLISRLKQIVVAGPFACVGSPPEAELCVPAPLDLLVDRRDDNRLRILPLRPWDLRVQEGGCDVLPEQGLSPVLLSEDVSAEFKPEPPPKLWSMSRMTEWLVNTRGDGAMPENAVDWPSGYFRGATKDTRFHVQMSPSSGSSADGMLFSTTGLDLNRLPPASATAPWTHFPELTLTVRVGTDAGFGSLMTAQSAWLPLGGERRLVKWQESHHEMAERLWKTPSQVRAAFSDAAERPRLIRMVLATPALFARGWLPKWLASRNGFWVGNVPGTNVTVRLIGACLDRWQAISGWSHEPPEGPKPVRRMVPAGSVYFLGVESGDPSALADRWLESVSDADEDRRDGFGLALWGTWEPFKTNHTFEKRTP